MSKVTQILRCWLPALLVMLIIFFFSSQPASDLPDFGRVDALVKKGGHVFGYAILALSYWYAFGVQADKRSLSWILAIGYAATDELHQSFVAGRHPTIFDVLIFDNIGAIFSLWYFNRRREKQ